MRLERLQWHGIWLTAARVQRGVIAAASVLVLPVSLLLFLQWPLREWLHAYSREANDLAQILFAVYVSVAITAATRAHTHLAAGVGARRSGGRMQSVLTRFAALLVLVPWSSFVLYAAWTSVIQSVRQLEGFPETYNPGYFLIRIALVALALLVLVQAIADALRPPRAGSLG
jgi:TRAP-type mannitol/chloroaromatic compound transport system permease small subunit